MTKRIGGKGKEHISEEMPTMLVLTDEREPISEDMGSKMLQKEQRQKFLRQKRAGYVRGTSRRSMCLKQSEGEGGG